MPRHLISDAHEWINEIPTVPLSEGAFPGCWKRARLALLPKQGGGYRPICIVSSIGKILDKMIAGRVLHWRVAWGTV